jgi:iron(III) transport system ATP-binding protein
MATKISIRNITKTFPTPGGGTTRAIDDATLTVEPGELFFLLGPSGCGKTTLLRAVAGFVDPTQGSITFERDGVERDVTHLPANQRHTAMVFQSYALWPHMTVADNVAFGLKVRKIPPADRKARVEEALAAVQMEEYASRKPTQLSGGQQQRVALARALVVRPDVLLLDEPLSNLDAKLRLDLRAEIRRIVKEAGLTAVYVTHDQKEALSMADRIAVMRSGRVEQLAAPQDLYHRPKTRFVAEFLGETNHFHNAELADANTGSGDDKTVTIAGQPLPVRAPTDADPGPVLALARPEALHIAAEDDPHALAATVTRSTFLGEHTQHDLELTDGTPARLTEPGAPAPRQPGSTLHFTIDPEHLIVLPA